MEEFLCSDKNDCGNYLSYSLFWMHILWYRSIYAQEGR